MLVLFLSKCRTDSKSCDMIARVLGGDLILPSCPGGAEHT